MTCSSLLAAGHLALALALPNASWARNLLSGTLFQANSPLARLPAGRGGHALTVGPKRVGYLQIAADGTLQVGEVL
ncbi:MAG: hypothetical protein IJ658_08210 [Kiritimatiellae bacterium]|nr:hypothetical protein [Kiritimatiellia bacterium]